MNDDDQPPGPAITDEEWDAAALIVEAAADEFRATVPAQRLEAYCDELAAYLLCDPEGRALLRRTMADPQVGSSDAVAKAPRPVEAHPTKKASG